MTLGSATISGGLLVVILTMYDSNFSTNASISDNKGNTFTNLIYYESVDYTIAVWYCNNFTGGASHQFTATASTGGYGAFSVAEITGCATSDVVDSGATSTETTTSGAGVTTASVTSPALSQAEEIVFGIHIIDSTEGDDGAPSLTTGGGSLYIRENIVADHVGFAAYTITSSTSAVTHSWAYGTTIDSSAPVYRATCAFKAPAAASSTGKLINRRGTKFFNRRF